MAAILFFSPSEKSRQSTKGFTGLSVFQKDMHLSGKYFLVFGLLVVLALRLIYF